MPETEITEPTFAIGDHVIVNSIGGIEYDPETGEATDNRPTGKIVGGPIGHDIPDIIQHAYVYEIEFDDAEAYPISPVAFNVEFLELIEGQRRSAGKKATSK